MLQHRNKKSNNNCNNTQQYATTMANAGKIFGITALVALVGGIAYKGVSFVNKVKQASGNVNFNLSFLRIHGLIGDGITKFISPTVRVLFNLNTKNFSGFDIEVTKIFARVESNKVNSTSWSVVASTNNYTKLNLRDASETNTILTFDFKGLSTITSLLNKTNRHRIVLTYNYKGQQLETIKDIDITGPLNSFWQKATQKFNSLKGLTSATHLAF